MCFVCKRKGLTIDVIKPFLKDGVSVEFMEFKGWMKFFLDDGETRAEITADGDHGGYFHFKTERSGDAEKKPLVKNAHLETVPPVDGRRFYMRDGTMTGALKHTSPYWSDGDSGKQWSADGRVKTTFGSSVASEFDLVEMQVSRLFG